MVLFSRFIALSLFIFAFACETIPPPYCISKGTQPVINWGEIYHDKVLSMGYSLDSNARLNKLLIDSSSRDPKLEYLHRVTDDRFCRILSMLNNEILKTQTLNSPGENTSRFIEYNDISKGIRIRSIWNPEFNTVGSKGFRVIYDSLNALIGY